MTLFTFTADVFTTTLDADAAMTTEPAVAEVQTAGEAAFIQDGLVK